MSFSGWIRLDAIFANAGAAGGDDDSDMEALGKSDGGEEWVDGSTDGWTEVVRLTGSA